MPDRRQFLATVGSTFGVASVSGCLEILSIDSTAQSYPGGTILVENAAERSLAVSVTVAEDEYDASLETTVSGGETHVRRGFVAADAGAVVTLTARLGDRGDPTTFDFLPAGGEKNARPEVARLTIHNAVEASADWTAMRGTR
ncbi:hypothetical protein [Halorhabdus rudnickae]|uniref:hypothetical protein n=1 Tax=Halorhabdus rudnickae TaxID=1775544 RepID=UPI001083C408|nr:hypothetical protein [Halorhabdus rudnickae]